MTSSKDHNHLAGEASPYLEQHVDNPVDWYPWGDQAFQKAKEEDKPIFLSIGYATCHWCHVMEAESFEDPLVANMLNDTFINIKVDREELPGVDALYMEYAQTLLDGAGGWPLNVVLTPDLKPFFAATYMPKDGDVEHIGFKEVIRRINALWHSEERERLLAQADDVVLEVEEENELIGDQIPVADLLDGVFELIYQLSDPTWGGFHGAPKFPMGYQVSLLLRAAKYRADGRALFCADKALEMMYRGGIYDHLGGGMARYCVDHKWMVPHFEKMCVDNALVALAYVEGWQMTKTPLYRAVAEDILRYLLTDMHDTNGGFFSAEDADSEGKEGYYYTWSVDEILDLLGQSEAELFIRFFGLVPEGNFEDGRSILYIPHKMEEFAKRTPFSPMEVAERIALSRMKLLEAREQRVRPIKDDKIVAGWNGLVVQALAEGFFAFGAKRYLHAADRCVAFIKKEMWDGQKLVRRWRKGHAGKPACLEDYTFLISGLLSLFRATGSGEYLAFAIELANVVTADFATPDGTFYRTDGSDTNLIVRQIDFYDGAEPSGLAVHADNLLRLHQITGARRYRDEAVGILPCSEALLQSHPLGGGYHCIALMRSLDQKQVVVVIALNESGHLKDEIARALAEKFMPHVEVIWRDPNDLLLQQLIPSVRGQGPIDGQTTLYLCHDGGCHPPITDAQGILESITAIK